ncbi:MAG TPA: hypothetical protein VN281_19165 [Verrucomicrobiae bacterium]|jgi:hypothetical protein|nr:hypothetical protein [Verrucomicrobiae bacterium]
MEKEKLLKEWAELQKEPKPVPRTNEFIKRHATAEIRILEELLAAAEFPQCPATRDRAGQVLGKFVEFINHNL